MTKHFHDDLYHEFATVTEGADAPGSARPDYTLRMGDTFHGSLSSGDSDWIALDLVQGQNVAINMSGRGSGAVADPYLFLYEADGGFISFDDDGGFAEAAQIEFVADRTATYYVAAWGLSGGYLGGAGDYTISVSDLGAPLPVFDNDQVANYLTHGYWADAGSQWRRFDLGADRVLDVDISSLTGESRQFALAALQAWSDVTGITFEFVDESLGAQAHIYFDDNDQGAYSYSTTSGNVILRSVVNVSTSWIAGDLDSGQARLNSYSMSTYIHEIGHALGLGHAGNYNGSANFGTTPETGDNHYLNDSWMTSVLSYHSPQNSSYDQGALGYHVTPMVADTIAVQALYGASGAERAGDTIYGRNSTAGGTWDRIADLPGRPVLFTLYDEGGTDTLDLGHVTVAQSIDLREEAVSDVMGAPGTMSIARGTVIENLISGGGNDRLTGNGADNLITGGGGSDWIVGGDGFDSVIFAGQSSGYIIETVGGITTVATGSEQSTLTEIEKLIFADREMLLTTSPAVVTVQDLTVASGRYVALEGAVSVSNGGSAITSYEIIDNTGAHSVHLAGQGARDASTGLRFAAADLPGVSLQGEATLGAQTLSLRVEDGQGWSDWAAFTLTTARFAPDLAVSDLAVGRSAFVALEGGVSYSDRDGHSAQSYELLDLGGGHSFYLRGVGAVDAYNGYRIDAGQLGDVFVEGAAQDGAETLRLRVFDGADWSDWAGFQVITGDTAPRLVVEDATTSIGRWTSLESLTTVVDPDGDAPRHFEIRDTVGGHSFYEAAAYVIDARAGYQFTAAELSNIWIKGDDTQSVQTLSARVHDGSGWSDWTDFTLSTSNRVATVAVTDLALNGGSSQRLIDRLDFVDIDGDSAQRYEVLDASGSDTFHLDGKPLEAALGYELTAAEMARLTAEADPLGGRQSLFLRAHDGVDWSDWSSFDLNSGAGNPALAAPVYEPVIVAPEEDVFAFV